MNRNRKEKRLWTERKGGERIKYFRGSDELEEADFITRTAHAGISGEPDCTVAVLYRTNAQSRVIEDALMRSGMAYRIVGGVRFYERKEIKDALAYLKLLLNPHDDVSLRRVINVPTRGIGKGVMDSIDHDLRRGGAAAAGRRRHRDAGAALALDEAERAPSTSGWSRRARSRRCARSGISSSNLSGRRAQGASVDRARQGARSVGLSSGSARRQERGLAEPPRQPDGARVGRARIRRARARGVARRLHRPAVAAVGSGRRAGQRATRASG